MRAFVFDLGDAQVLVLAETEQSARNIAVLNYPEFNDEDYEPSLSSCPVREVGLGDSFVIE